MSAAVGASLVALPAVAEASSALPAGFSFFKLKDYAGELLVGPDGNMWSGYRVLQRITPRGVVTVYPTMGGPITVRQGKIWSPTGSTTMSGVVTTYPDFLPPPFADGTTSLAAGPHGGLWFSNYWEGVGLLDSQRTPHFVTAAVDAGQVILGPDGAMWFTVHPDPGQPAAIGRIASDATVTEYTGQGLGDPNSLTFGPNGTLWFLDGNADGGTESIGQITMDGRITHVYSPSLPKDIQSITFGPCGLLWLAERGTGIGSMTQTGEVKNYWQSSSKMSTSFIVAGPDEALWFGTAGLSIGRFDPQQAGIACR